MIENAIYLSCDGVQNISLSIISALHPETIKSLTTLTFSPSISPYNYFSLGLSLI